MRVLSQAEKQMLDIQTIERYVEAILNDLTIPDEKKSENIAMWVMAWATRKWKLNCIHVNHISLQRFIDSQPHESLYCCHDCQRIHSREELEVKTEKICFHCEFPLDSQYDNKLWHPGCYEEVCKMEE